MRVFNWIKSHFKVAKKGNRSGCRRDIVEDITKKAILMQVDELQLINLVNTSRINEREIFWMIRMYTSFRGSKIDDPYLITLMGLSQQINNPT